MFYYPGWIIHVGDYLWQICNPILPLLFTTFSSCSSLASSTHTSVFLRPFSHLPFYSKADISTEVIAVL